MAYSAGMHTQDILSHARSRDIETALGIWTLLAGPGSPPERNSVIEALASVIPDAFLTCRKIGEDYIVDFAGDRLAITAEGTLFHAIPGTFDEEVRGHLSAVFDLALRTGKPVYSDYFDRRSALIHRWELLALPVQFDDGPGIINFQLPLAYHQDFLMAIIGSNPFAIFAAQILRDASGIATDFTVNLVNDAG